MKYVWKVVLALFLIVFAGRAESASEWVTLQRTDKPESEWVKVATGEEGRVVGEYKNTYTIDVGVSQGARLGGVYLVYSADHKKPAGALKVVETSDKFSFCRRTGFADGGVVKVGDKVIPASISGTKEAEADSSGAVVNKKSAIGYITGDNTYVVYSSDGMPIYPVSAPYADEDIKSGKGHTPMIVPANTQPGAAPVPYDGPESFPGVVTYPPFPNYSETSVIKLDFDANRIADARLIRTFPLTQPQMNALEAEFRGGLDLYNKKKYNDAIAAFSLQYERYRGNFLSPYWAGICALKAGDKELALEWFNSALSLNPYHIPSRDGTLIASGAVKEKPQKAAPSKAKVTKHVKRTKKAAK